MPSTLAIKLARQLLGGEIHGEMSDDATIVAAEQVCTVVTAGLSRWFGAYGSHALVTRALASVQASHPALRGVAMTEAHCLVGLAESASAHGAMATREGVVAMFAALADLLGRLIGDELALSLLQQSATLPAAGHSSAPAEPRTDADSRGPGRT
ncbi:MAG: hypothetical protein ABIY52_09840 [Gemmatimonadaceae bacterium]